MTTPGMPPLQPARPPAYRRRPIQLITLAVVVIVAVVLALTLSGGSSKKVVLGQFTLTGGSKAFTTTGTTCQGTGKWSYLKPGAFVTLYGEHQDYLTTNGLQPGRLSSGSQCIFTFYFGKIRVSPNSYQIVVGSTYTRTISKAALKSIGYTFYLVDGL